VPGARPLNWTKVNFMSERRQQQRSRGLIFKRREHTGEVYAPTGGQQQFSEEGEGVRTIRISG